MLWCQHQNQGTKIIASKVVYIHCYTHCLNLVLVDTAKALSEDFVFLSAS